MSELSRTDYTALRLHTGHNLVDLSITLCDVQKRITFLIEACKSDDTNYTKHHIKNIYDLKSRVNSFQSDFESFLVDFDKCQ